MVPSPFITRTWAVAVFLPPTPWKKRSPLAAGAAWATRWVVFAFGAVPLVGVILSFDLEIIHALLADKVLRQHVEYRVFNDAARIFEELLTVRLFLQVTHVTRVLVVDLL